MRDGDKDMFIDIKLKEIEIECGIREIKRSCAQNDFVKQQYVLNVHNFFSKIIEDTTKEIYKKILLEKKDKCNKFSREEVKEIIKEGAEQFVAKYIDTISHHDIGGIYSKYNLDRKEIDSLKEQAYLKCSEQSEMLCLEYRNYLKVKWREFRTEIFSFISMIAAIIGAAIMLLQIYKPSSLS